MGIHGLWQVLEPTGRPVNIHSLRGKVLSIDVSIWLHQLVKGFRDKDGNPLPNAHLLGVFHRVCKLLNEGIKPVFVFDGGVPVLKRQTLAARRQRKVESLDKAEISRHKILSTYLRQQLQRQMKTALPPSLRMQAQIEALSSGGSKRSPTVSPRKRKYITSSQESLVSGEESSRTDVKVDEDLQAFRDALIKKLEDDVDEVTAKTESDSDENDESLPNAYQYGVDYSENFSIIQKPDFDTLPLETQHEILFEMQESRKMNSWGKFDKMPKDLHSFSNFQMDRLVKRRALQKKIQSVQKEMGQRHIHVQNLDDLLKMDYNNFEDKETKITGSKDDGFVLIKSQTSSKAEGEPKPGTSTAKTTEVITIDDFMEDSSSDNEKVTTSTTNVCESGMENRERTEIIHNNVKTTPSDEEDADIKLAIELSLRDMGEPETSKNTNEKNSITASPTQKNLHLTSTDKNVDNTQKHESPLSIQPSQISHCAKFLDTVGFHLAQSHSVSENDSESLKFSQPTIPITDREEQTDNSTIKHKTRNDSESSSDDDFEDVVDVPIPKVSNLTNNTIATIDFDTIKKIAPGEVDIFADVFLEETKRCEDISADEKRNESVVHEVPDDASLAVSNDEKFEKKWYSDSDSDIEADLMEMVMKESAVILHPKEEQAKSPTNKKTFTSSFDDTNAISESTHLLEVANSDPTDKGSDNRQVKMITTEYMQVQGQLNSKLGKLHSEMGRQERMATSISDQMQIETQELISLFGIPYVVSPTEAESQCAFLDRACLTEGTITDDSDVWLFGGQRVYKNFFSQGQKHVELYQAADIQRILNLNREKLILLAIMIGNDYSDGIQGVGPVLALEILSEFAFPSLESFEILVKFHEWWEEMQTKPCELFSGSKLKEKIRKLKIRPGFPSRSVYDAFINPTIDTSTESFKWGNPDLDAIRSYTKQRFGWEQSKCDSLLLPVLKKRQCELDQSRQLTLDSYISFGKMPSLDGGKRKKGSKRIQTAVKRLKRVGVESHELNLSSDSDSNVEETEGKRSSSTAHKQVTNRVVNGKKSLLLRGKMADKTKNSHEKPQRTTSSPGNPIPSTSSTIPNLKSVSPKKSEVIPQRVQSESNNMKNKQKAIEIFKMKKNQ